MKKFLILALAEIFMVIWIISLLKRGSDHPKQLLIFLAIVLGLLALNNFYKIFKKK